MESFLRAFFPGVDSSRAVDNYLRKNKHLVLVNA